MVVERTCILRTNGTFSEHAESIRALLFGILVGLAKDKVEHYLSDLYHDAQWLGRGVNGPTEFYFGVRSHGTDIGHDIKLISAHNFRVYEIRLFVERYSWYVEVRTPDKG